MTADSGETVQERERSPWTGIGRPVRHLCYTPKPYANHGGSIRRPTQRSGHSFWFE